MSDYQVYVADSCDSGSIIISSELLFFEYYGLISGSSGVN